MGDIGEWDRHGMYIDTQIIQRVRDRNSRRKTNTKGKTQGLEQWDLLSTVLYLGMGRRYTVALPFCALVESRLHSKKRSRPICNSHNPFSLLKYFLYPLPLSPFRNPFPHPPILPIKNPVLLASNLTHPLLEPLRNKLLPPCLPFSPRSSLL